MPPKVDPEEPDEAIAWFKKRVPMPRSEWLELDERAREKAFTIARVAQLTMVADVFEKLAGSLERGESFETFKTNVREQLTNAWGEDRPWHIETVFRNASQRAYSAGRREQLSSPALLRQQTYWVLTPLMDGRTSPICEKLRPRVVLPANHSFFKTHWPPLHHRCRTIVYGVNQEQAEQMGMSVQAPDVPAAPGFGGADPLEWQPELKSVPPELVKAYRAGEE